MLATVHVYRYNLLRNCIAPIRNCDSPQLLSLRYFEQKTETDFVYNWYSNLFIAYLKNESDNNTIILIVVFITSQYYFSYLVGNQVITTPLFK